MESVIFLYSKGGTLRRRIIQFLYKERNKMMLHYLSTLSDEIGISKPAMKKHVDSLTEFGYIDKVNPGGNPTFLRLTEKGCETAKRYIYY